MKRVCLVLSLLLLVASCSKTDTGNPSAPATGSYALSLSVSPANGGNIQKSPDAATYAFGTSVVMTALPSAGYVFAYWSGDVSGTVSPMAILVDANKTVTAVFVLSNALSAPIIIAQPTARTVTVGQSASFTVVAYGNPTPTYQWRKGGTNISGATSATLTIPATVSGDAGSYSVVVTNSQGTVTSAAVILTVNENIPLAGVSIDSSWNSDSSWYDNQGLLQYRYSRDYLVGFTPEGTGSVQCTVSVSVDGGKTWSPTPSPLQVLDNGIAMPVLCGVRHWVKLRVIGKDLSNVMFRITFIPRETWNPGPPILPQL